MMLQDDKVTFKMPWEGDHTQQEADKGARGEQPVRYIGDHLNTVVDDSKGCPKSRRWRVEERGTATDRLTLERSVI